MSRLSKLLPLIFAAILVAVTTACSHKDTPAAAAQQTPPVPVALAMVAQRTIPVEVRAIGNVEAFTTISVKSQVSGELQKVFFTEGDMVQKGQTLFQVDPRPAQETIRQLEANLVKDEVQAKNAETDAARARGLFQQGVLARQQADQLTAAADALKATLDADRAAIQNAKLQLEYTKIDSPITGRTGNILIKAGNLVKANDLPLVTINQVEPIYVSFAVPEVELPEIRNRFNGGLTVLATPQGESRPSSGKLTFIDNSVDPATGTIKLKATFPNSDHRLWPGQFVNVVLAVSHQPNAILVPSQAVQTGQKGQYVYVVKADGLAEYRAVAVGRTAGDYLAVTGVNPGEQVIVDGQSKVVPGARVQPVKRDNPPAQSAGGQGS